MFIMEAINTHPGKIIGNVGTLDLRTATAETVAQIQRIGNVGIVLYTPETAGLILRLNLGNVGASMIQHGKPVIRGTRVPISRIVGGLAGGMTVEEVCREYELTEADVRAALEYATEVIESETVHALPA